MVTHQQRLAAHRTGRGLRTAIAIVLLALMLFPVYWMLNISLQSSGGTLATRASFPRTPAWPATHGYPGPGPNLVTSMLIAVGTVVLTLLIAAPCCVRPGPVPVPLDQLGLARHPDLADDPGDRDRERPLHPVREHRPAQLHPRV